MGYSETKIFFIPPQFNWLTDNKTLLRIKSAKLRALRAITFRWLAMLTNYDFNVFTFQEDKCYEVTI